VPCLALFLGLGAGFLANVFDKPVVQNRAVKSGAYSGALAGIGVIIGQIIGALINSSVVDSAAAAEILQDFGYAMPADFDTIYTISQVGGTICFSLLDILFMVLTGMLGGFIWWKMRGPKPTNPVIVDL
jgi:MFS family permease